MSELTTGQPTTSQPATGEPTTREPTTTRRAVMTRAGIATAAGLAAAATATSAGAASATTRSAAAGTGVGRGAPGQTVVEFRARIQQGGPTGESFDARGFLTSVRGLDQSSLFSGTPQNVGTALFTAHAAGVLTARVLDQSVHALDIVATMAVHRRTGPGADWTHPGSFTSGHLLAEYALTLQDVLAVFAPAQGLPTLTGELRQTRAAPVGGQPSGQPGPAGGPVFGALGQLLRMQAAGLGQLVDPVTLNAHLEIAGSWIAT